MCLPAATSPPPPPVSTPGEDSCDLSLLVFVLLMIVVFPHCCVGKYDQCDCFQYYHAANE